NHPIMDISIVIKPDKVIDWGKPSNKKKAVRFTVIWMYNDPNEKRPVPWYSQAGWRVVQESWKIVGPAAINLWNCEVRGYS
ncbi:hypothetical protein, partial [Exiguobacterium indicum]|uniref:hypothetical protein n=1 Tax=Exiguobacterium indicum TaxID=296995 RepID=UPI002B25C1F2